MLALKFGTRAAQPFRILCIGAHSDDIEIGCGGTVLRLLGEHPAVEVYWFVLSAIGQRALEARASADLFLARAAKKRVDLREFRDGFLPYSGAEAKLAFEEVKKNFSPDLVLTHHRHDLHQDHRMVSELTWNTFRDHLILEYEIAKYDGDIGSPNFFVQLPGAVCRQKIQHLLASFETQRTKRWFTEDTFLAMLRLRGLECNAEENYAEAFYSRKARY